MANQCSAPGCSGVERVRVNRTTGEEFYGCSNYPKCKKSRPMEVVQIEDRDLLDNGPDEGRE